MRICFDLDLTLCTGKPYATAQPYSWAVDLLSELKSEGHTIIIYTARGMDSNKGNVSKVIHQLGKLTLDQLDQWGFQYDEIYFGKPSADLYIDDKAFGIIDPLFIRQRIADYSKP